VGFAALQLAASVLMDGSQPELRDPEFGYKLMGLRARLADEPGKPLLLVLGSSRAALGLSPEDLQLGNTDSGHTPIVFNFAMTGSGPLLELICLRRLLAAGAHPDWLIIEVLPPLMHQEEGWGEASWLNINRLGWRDLSVIRRYTDDPLLRYRRWVRSRLTPWSSHRFAIMSRYAPGWLAWDARQDGWKGLDRSGWLPYPLTSVTAEQYQAGIDFARKQYLPPLFGYVISEKPDRALREMLDLCKQEHITALLLLMPEGSAFRSWYTPEARATFETYLAGLSQDYQVPIIDAHCWLPDSAFYDGHHLLRNGAAAFSHRLADEVLRPLFRARQGEPGTEVAHGPPPHAEEPQRKGVRHEP
jgi:hypothetical protein